MAPPYPQPAQPPKRRRGCMFYGVIAVAAIILIGIIAAVASSGGGDSKTGDEATTKSEPSASAPAKTGGGQAGGEANDVKVDECIVERTLGWPKAELVITNNSSKTSNYLIQVEFVDSATNVRLSEGVAASNNVAPGQSVQTTAQGTGDAKGKTITCRVTSVDRMMSR